MVREPLALVGQWSFYKRLVWMLLAKVPEDYRQVRRVFYHLRIHSFIHKHLLSAFHEPGCAVGDPEAV